MFLMEAPPPRFLVLGQLRREFILPLSGRPRLDIPGGNLLYAGAGLSIWETGVGLVTRVGEDLSPLWVDKLGALGYNIKGINVLPQEMDVRYFVAYTDSFTPHTENPVAQFARLGASFHELYSTIEIQVASWIASPA